MAPLFPQSIWRPPLETSWQWQLTGSIDLSLNVDMYDLDLFQTDASTVSTLHSREKKAVCYVSVGTFEPYRPDAGRFPESVKGSKLEDFPDERWLDIRQLDILRPIIESRFDTCKQKGFDGVEPDNVDGYTNKTGFPLTAAHQLQFNRMVADLAHARGLSVGLKNDISQIADLVANFDWALNEQCFQYNECSEYRPFTAAGKAVFHVEYERTPAQFCQQANSLNFNSLKKTYDLDAFRVACRETPDLRASNGGSYATAGISPGQIMKIGGTDLGPAAGATYQIVNGSLTTELSGTRVLFNGSPAALLYVSSSQANVIVPYSIAGKATVTVEVERNGTKRPGLTYPVVAAQPGVFTTNASGAGQAAAVNQDGTLNGPTNPIARGSLLFFYATGEGATTPEGSETRITGVAGIPRPRGTVSVKLGTMEAPVEWSGSTPQSVAGLYQVNIWVPANAPTGDQVPLSLTVAGMPSQTGVTVAIR